MHMHQVHTSVSSRFVTLTTRGEDALMLTLTAPAHPALRLVGVLEPMPAILGQKWGTPLDMSPVYGKANA